MKQGKDLKTSPIYPSNNQRFGKRIEDDIEWQSEMVGTLYLIKQYPKVEFFGAGKVKVTGKAYPDFIGIDGSNWILFDAKGISNKNSFSPDTRRRHQFESLKSFSRMSRFCFFLVYWDYWREGEAFLVTPDTLWKPKFKRGDGQYRGSGDLWFKELYEKMKSDFKNK